MLGVSSPPPPNTMDDLKAPRKQSLTECIRHVTWAWFTIVMGTGVVSTLADLFPFGSGSFTLKGISSFFFILNLVIFAILWALTLARFSTFPLWSKMLRHPTQSLFIGCLPMAATSLINSALVCRQQFGFSDISFVYVLWGFWWIDAMLSVTSAFGMLYVMMTVQDHVLSRMSLVWLLPIIPLIVSSSTGALLAQALKVNSTAVALFTTGVSLTMVLIGLSFSLMVIATYFMRLILHGPPDPTLILSGFIALGPFGQGGFSLLINGQTISELLSTNDASVNNTGQIIYVVCVCAAVVLWSMGVAWFIVSVSATLGLLRRHKIPFAITHWGLVFPHGVFALLSVQLGKVLDSLFFRYFGAIGSVATFILWISLFFKTVPAIIDASIFVAPCLTPSETPLVDENDKALPAP